ncbi:hypothetical protein [Asticcacaulis benevestitus]|uniref:Uncharacterized protein n=1 Tax=Asticcacaulis benevestitus DSM 16100 = ATCC BAA-896 TaxID=1121022 RepID=V4RGC3_9CAUL|nr:hypothetical protein [Asticcacaulis benevestitus]ESQ90398.1 hypothetical protein ABENE_12470 [Asticcacaulis benevestitus DSM 16100 = ATCC BAA-896]
MQKIDAVNWISAARSCAPAQCAAAFVSAMATPRNRTYADTQRQPSAR